jgi:NTP pyrophosphatase (non-canonical NTP hydrolase)
MLDYSPQINQYLQSQMQHLDPQMQQLLKSMTPQQMNQAVQASPQLQQALQTQVQDVTLKSKNTQYYLDKLQEEAAEIVQAVSKLRRFGPNNHHPERKTSNLQELVGELEDFLALVACLEADKLIDLTHSQEHIKRKFQAVYKQ